ncbi:MAG TPA: beta-ketoacyl synthase N-terminal-like domain-containing protein, partial [Leptospiraceae bacterium]|nr:beta-ketoacyl synthase N-terminal-like domain-containing protein [Leptospiraceae bacterium]
MKQPVIIDGARTAFGSFGGSLKDLGSTELGVISSKSALEKSNVKPEEIGEIIFGNVVPSEKNAIYLSRHIGLKTGLPVETPALTVNRLCGSGMEAVILGAKKILLGEAEAVLTGGSESMSQAPYVVRSARWGVKYGPTEFEDMLNQGLTDIYVELPMGMTAENLAMQYNISREDQDEWAAISQERAERATVEGLLKAEIVPVTVGGKTPVVFDKDEFIRGKAAKDKMSGLKPA